jgi:hypothetical protein
MNPERSPGTTITPVGLDLIDFYAAGGLPERQRELLKRKVNQLDSKLSEANFHRLAQLRGILDTLRLVQSRREKNLERLHSVAGGLLRSVLELKPEDFLIIMAHQRTGPNSTPPTDDELSTALRVSVPHLQFRRNQLLKNLESHSPSQLKEVCNLPPSEFDQDTRIRPSARTSFMERFRSMPLALRFLFETGVVLSILVFLMWLIPEIRNRYENSIQKRINDYMIESTLTDAPAPEGIAKDPKIVEAASEPSDIEPEAVQTKSETGNKKPLKVSAGETWRFSFTGANTQDVLTGLAGVLKRLGREEPKSLTVPGGIQFDFYVPTADLTQLKLNLEELTANLQRRTRVQAGDTPTGVNMSWYKKKGMTGRKIPAGHVEVVIWVNTL